jgi:helicase
MIPDNINKILEARGFKELRPSQTKAIDAGLFEDKNLLICTPTGSGKTLVAELAALNVILNKKQKVVYIVPLKALAQEKYREFKERYKNFKTALSIGDLDSSDSYLVDYDLVITTSEKLDSLLRHKAEWINELGCLVVDEIHLLNDSSRGPTLEITITLLRQLLKNIQLIGLSATIGNPQELADWLNAELVIDNWRPVELKQGVYFNGDVVFEDA